MNNQHSVVRRRPSRRRAAWSSRGRVGTASVELALCLPVLLVIGLGMIETSNVVSIQSRLETAAYEGVRLATRPTTSNATAATATAVSTYCQTVLAQLGVNGATVTVSPSSLANLTPQTMVTVSITAPWSQNSVTSFVLRNSLTLSAAATLVIE